MDTFALFIVRIFIFLFYILIVDSQTPFVKTDVSKLKRHSKFSTDKSHSYKNLLIHENTLIIGGANNIFVQNLDNISLSKFPGVSWDVSEDDRTSCMSLPSGGDGKKCYNQVQMIQRYNSTHFVTCATNAMEPENKFLVVNEDEATLTPSKISKSAMCSYDPDDSVTSYSVGHGDRSTIFATNRLNQRENIGIVKPLPDNQMIKSKAEMRTGETEFVGSFSDIDVQARHGKARKIYFVSNEPDTGATITQICASDIGGMFVLKNEWTSLLKARLTCQLSDGLSFDVVRHIHVGADNTLYGVFTTKHSTYGASAVCSFRIVDIQKIFNSGQVVSGESPTNRNTNSMRFTDSDYTPGMCAYPGMEGLQNASSKDFPMNYLEYVESHYTMEPTVKPAFPPSTDYRSTVKSRDPLLNKSEYTFTKIVTETVTGLDGSKYEVGYIGTSTGSVYKFAAINNSKSPYVNEMAEYKISDSEILSMEISSSRESLYVATKDAVHQISTSNCELYTQTSVNADKCRMCVLARDPHCAWDPNQQVCVSVLMRHSPHLKQDIMGANVSKHCGDQLAEFAVKNNTAEVHEGETVILGNAVVDNIAAEVLWTKQTVTDNYEVFIKETPGKYRITDNQLIIFNFATKDMGEYKYEYKIQGSLIFQETISVKVPGYIPIPPLTSTIGTSTTADRSNITKTEPVPRTAQTSTFIVIGVLFFVIVIILVAYVCYKRIMNKRKHDVSKHKRRYEDTTDSMLPKQQLMSMPQATNNGSNNSNNRSLEGSFESQILLKNEEQLSPRFEYYGEPNDHRTKSLDFLGADPSIKYADETDPNNQVNRTHSTMEISHKRKRTPLRANSQPLSRISINFGGKNDKSFENCTLTRKKGKWVVELPPEFSPPGVSNTSRNSENVDNEAVNGSMFQPTEVAPLATLDATLDMPPFSLTEHNSTSVLADDGGGSNKRGAQAGQRSRTGSLRSQKNNSSDSDCTMQASNLTLKPEGTPVVVPKITPPQTLPKPKNYSRRSNKTLAPSVNDDDPNNQLHGQPKVQTLPTSDLQKPAVTSATSPAKSSHSLSSSSSNESRGSSVYKSARSSLNSDEHSHLVSTL